MFYFCFLFIEAVRLLQKSYAVRVDAVARQVAVADCLVRTCGYDCDDGFWSVSWRQSSALHSQLVAFSAIHGKLVP